MSSRTDKIMPAPKLRKEEVYVDFNPDELKAPFLLRCGALLIDYIFLVSIPIISLIAGRFMGNDGGKLLNSELSNAGWLITVLLGITNFAIFPMFAGQTIGKMLTGLRVVKIDGSVPNFTSLLIRHVIGYPLTAITGFLGFMFSIFNSKGRALHDYISGTVVIYGQRREKNS